MKLQKTLLGLLVLSFIYLPFNLVKAAPVYAQNEQVIEIEAKPVDRRALILKDYLAKHNSPLENSAQDFIDAADTYSLDWKLVAAISGVESTFGKRIPGGHDPLYSSYNGWGWGVYGDNSLGFKSWRDAIFTISQGLKENYIDKGYTEPFSINKKYAASQSWGKNVTFFMNDIEKFAQSYPVETDLAQEIKPEDNGNFSNLLAYISESLGLDVVN